MPIAKKKNAKYSPIYKRLVAFAHDALAAFFAWFLAYYLRFNFNIPSEVWSGLWQISLAVVPVQLVICIYVGLYRGVWRFASTLDLKRILVAVGFSAVFISTAILFINPSVNVPRSILILDPILLVMLMGGSRFFYRNWKEHRLYGSYLNKGAPVIILGAGEASVSLIRDLWRSSKWRVVAVLDDDEKMIGREILGAKVQGQIKDLADISSYLEVKHVIISMPSLTHMHRAEILEFASSLGLEVLTVPAFDDLMSGKVTISQVRKVEVEDLLGRDAVSLDVEGLQHLIEQSTVMVSGAGGSIGSELCRQIIKYKPTRMVCFDISEYALYRLEQELTKEFGNIALVFVTGDVKNAKRISTLMSTYKPKLVFHAAAYKHVPMMETNNVSEALANNVQGTYVLAHASMQAHVEKFVLISTDKAVNPTNVMGASKRLAEMVCQSLQGESKSNTDFVIVRFGNVLGSSGSVIPKFREQIAQGGPVTVTHPEITRYFMSIPEATQLVLQAGLMGKSGEIFVLDMGEPVKIADLARDMIRLSGFHEDDIKIHYTGLRPGEKLYEELLADDELTQATPHPKLRIALARKADLTWVNKLLKWIESCQLEPDEGKIKQQLMLWVEEYVAHEAAPANVPLPIASTLH
jgi:FlaA1/EpsC-like NDP-sugar epimerase